MRQKSFRRGTVAVVCAVAALGMTACMGKSDDSAASSIAGGSGTGTPGAPATTAAPKTPDPLTGEQLTRQLAPASFFAKALAVDPSATRDTGTTYQPQTSEAPPTDCSILGTTGFMTITGISGVSFTQQNRLDKNTTTEVYQGVDVFKGDTSTTVLDALSKVSARCPSFTDDETRTKVKVHVKSLAGVGDGAYTITLSCTGWQNSITLVAARVGTAVISVLSSDGKGSDGSAMAKKVAGHIATGLQGKA